MSVELTQYVRIKIPSQDEPLEITIDEAKALRNMLLKAFPVPTIKAPGARPDKWILRGRTWRRGTQTVSLKAIEKLKNHVGTDWKLFDDICDVTGYSEYTIRSAIYVLMQEQKIDRRGRGSTLEIRFKTLEYKSESPDVPKIDVVTKNHDLSALEKEQELKRLQMRER